MPGKMLMLTFHGNVTTGEDLRFKAEAIASGLVSGDVMDETGPKTFFDANRDLLLPPAKDPGRGGLTLAKLGNVGVVSMLNIVEKTWDRPGYVPDPDVSVFEQWLEKVFDVPAEVIVFAGHHSDSAVWGADTTGHKRIFCGFFPAIVDNKPLLTFFGHRPNEKSTSALTRSFDMTKAFEKCRLLVVLGCNGATIDIQDWRNAIKKATGGRAPFILGWYKTHLMPRDRKGQFFSPKFWADLAALAPGNPGNKNLDFLHTASFRDRIIEVWRDAMKTSFTTTTPKKEDQRHLFFDASRQRGAGAVDPDGNTFFVVNEAGKIELQGLIP